MAAFSFDRARAKRAVLATCVVAALTTAGVASARGKHPFADANAASPRFSREAMQRWLDTPRWMQTPLMAATRADGDDKGYGVNGLVPVTTCEDDLSAGSLRKKIEGAADGDIIDLTHLTCSTITLAHGELHLTKDRVTIFGPVDHTLTIDGADTSRILETDAPNSLGIYDVNFAHGKVTSAPYSGGCIYGYSIALTRSTVSNCSVESQHAISPGTYGGGIAANYLSTYETTISHNTASAAVGVAGGGGFVGNYGNFFSSNISDNSVESNATALGGGVDTFKTYFYTSRVERNSVHSFGGPAAGGGIDSAGVYAYLGSVIGSNSAKSDTDIAEGGGIVSADILIDRTTITANIAQSGTTATETVIGGGAVAIGGIAATYSTIDNNQAKCTTVSGTSHCRAVGGGLATSGHGGDDITLSNVTISENSVIGDDTSMGGGIFVDNQKALLAESSTIAFNQSSSTSSLGYAGGGIVASSPLGMPSILNNTIVASNTSASGPSNFSTVPAGHLWVTGANDLTEANGGIGAGVSVGNSANGWVFADPHLKPLGDNGGATKTHAIDNNSPAFNGGLATMASPKCDQRGAGFQRTVGTNPDIGAYEVQDPLLGDQVFFDGFDPEGTDDCNF